MCVFETYKIKEVYDVVEGVVWSTCLKIYNDVGRRWCRMIHEKQLDFECFLCKNLLMKKQWQYDLKMDIKVDFHVLGLCLASAMLSYHKMK